MTFAQAAMGLTPIIKSLEPAIEAAKYLHGRDDANATAYRKIVGVLYEARELGQVWVTRDDLVAAVRERYPDTILGPYLETNADQDLEQLVAWGALQRQQDTQVTTVEFWRRRLKFALAPIVVEIERAVRTYQARGADQGALDPSLLENLWKLAQALDIAFGRPIGAEPSQLRSDLRTAWVGFVVPFEELRRAGIDFQSALLKPDDTPSVELAALIAYKEQLQHALKAFGTRLCNYLQFFEDLLVNWDRRAILAWVIPALAAEDLDAVVRPGAKPSYADVEIAYRKQFAAIDAWCAPDGAGWKLAEAVNEAVRRAIRDTKRLQEQLRNGDSRQRDLAQLAALFAACPTREIAERVAAITLGLPRVTHLEGDRALAAETSHEPWVDEAIARPVAPVRRGRRAKIVGEAVPDDTADVEALQAEAARQRADERAQWSSLFQHGPVRFRDVFLTTHLMRNQLAQVIATCLTRRDRRTQAPDGATVELEPAVRTAPGRIRVRKGGALWLGQHLLRRIEPGEPRAAAAAHAPAAGDAE